MVDPDPPEENVVTEKEETVEIRGDTIGNTAYSESFVLNLLLKLNTLEYLDEDSLLEYVDKELCILWDMTTEGDVTEFLVNQNVMQIFCDVLKVNYSARLTEVVIGTMTNMCIHKIAVEKVIRSPPIRKFVCNYISCDDSLVILQVMKFIYANIYNGDIYMTSWLQFMIENDFAHKINNILTNSLNENLLFQTFETVNCMCSAVTNVSDKNLFKRTFVNKDFIVATLVAFEEMTRIFNESGNERLERCEILFLSIHAVITGFVTQQSSVYQDHLPNVLKVVNTIVTKYMQTNNEAIVDVIESITISLPIFYDANLQESQDLTLNLLQLWRKVHFCHSNKSNDADFNDSYNLDKDLEDILPQYFVRVFDPLFTTSNQLHLTLGNLDRDQIAFMSHKINEMINFRESIPLYYKKVATLLDNIIDNL